ncbi:hypothetical protein HanXRQr2_Chr09g0389171 [Helianthus annuus]|uniref:Uncharacterized protein n=1 Tax=Helianthus annuus TaxID=4232 RepID=A0A251TX33_HELAN|nr:hypothetical protein HanXRQr2_Chr09g0389171 [Helianthus annuus]KAJ0893212.1 hypothetical protein HanPSC8_Chr09g0375051 [Helianthus annuus]
MKVGHHSGWSDDDAATLTRTPTPLSLSLNSGYRSPVFWPAAILRQTQHPCYTIQRPTTTIAWWWRTAARHQRSERKRGEPRERKRRR